MFATNRRPLGLLLAIAGLLLIGAGGWWTVARKMGAEQRVTLATKVTIPPSG